MRGLLRDLRYIHRFVNDPALSQPHFPDEPRKSRARMCLDNVLWRVREGEVNTLYFRWGMDRLNGPRPAELLSYRRFRRLRDTRNRAKVAGEQFNYIAVLRDKLLFSLFAEAFGHPVMPVLAVVTADRIQWLRPARSAPLPSLLEEDDLDVFCKPLTGEQGRGVFPLRLSRGELSIDGAPATLEDVAARLQGRSVLQRRVVQHPDVARLHPTSLNTLRVITVRVDGVVRRLSFPILRMGVGGSSVDSIGSEQGLQAIVDPVSGRTIGEGVRRRAGRLRTHPDTGLDLAGFEVPFYHEAEQLAIRVHGDVPGVHTVGWDIAITPEGPLVMEGNDNWSASLRLGYPEFTREFLSVCGRA